MAAICFCISCQNFPEILDDRQIMQLNGPVRSVEVVSITTKPIGEMTTFFSNERYKIQCVDGDITIKFSEEGTLTYYSIYGQNNEELYSIPKELLSHLKVMKNIPPITHVEPEAHYILDNSSIDNEYDSLNRLLKTSYYIDNKLIDVSIYNYEDNSNNYRKVHYYGSEENPLRINFTKNTQSFSTDTTFVQYTKFDNHGNWIEAQKKYIGWYPWDKDSYIIKRQICYYGEEDDVLPLRYQINKKEYLSQYNKNYSWRDENVGEILTFNLPECIKKTDNPLYDMANRSFLEETASNESFTEEHYLYNYINNDALASIGISFSIRPDDRYTYDNLSEEELIYIASEDSLHKEAIREHVQREGKYLLLWKPYCFEEIGNHLALCYHFYKWDTSPFPFEWYYYNIPLLDGKCITLTFSWQSNHTAQFEPLKKRIIESIQFLQ